MESKSLLPPSPRFPKKVLWLPLLASHLTLLPTPKSERGGPLILAGSYLPSQATIDFEDSREVWT